MFQIFRLIVKRPYVLQHFRHACPAQSVFFQQKKWKSYSIEGGESHDERNMRLKRPQSPHLTIYKPQLTAMLSITQRGTGIALSSYFIALGLAAIVLPCDIPYYINELECLELGNIIISGLKFCLAFPICYHYWNGIRHLIWDTGALLSLPQVYATGYLMLLLAISSACFLAWLCVDDGSEEDEEHKQEEDEDF